MNRFALVLLVIATGALVYLAGMMAKDRWQLAKAEKSQDRLAMYEQLCRVPGEAQRKYCRLAAAVPFGDAAVAKVLEDYDPDQWRKP